MDLITRQLTKTRSSGFKQYFNFTTYSIVLDPICKKDNWPDDPKVRAVFNMLQTAFLTGFVGEPQSPSQMDELMIGVEKIQSPLCDMAKKSGYRGTGNKQHTNVQDYFMKNHPDCIAVEIPLWFDDVEGCADLLLMQTSPFHLVLPDFKPDAAKEKKAASQLYRYEKGLLRATEGIITQDDITLVYFDDKDCYKVKR